MNAKKVPNEHFFRFAAKVGIAGAAVKMLHDQGVFSTDVDTGVQLYEQTKRKIVPGTIIFPQQVIVQQTNTDNVQKVLSK